MSVTDIRPGQTTSPGQAGSEPQVRSTGRSPRAVAGAGIRAVYAAIAGLLLTCSLGVVLWAVTPSSGNGPVALLRAGVSAFSAGNGMTVMVGGAALTVPPLMITLVAIALLTTVGARGRAVTTDRAQELASSAVAATAYAAAVTFCGVLLGPTGAVRADQWWRPAVLALVVVGSTTLVRGLGWRPYLVHRLPSWVPVSVRLGAAGTAAVLGAGGVTVVIGLVRSWNDATTVASLAAPGAGGGFGMALLSIAYLPNAMVAGAGYASGVGFTVGGGSYSPLRTSPTELPAVTLLTAVPDSASVARSSLLILVLPLLAAVFIGRGAVRRLDRRSDRILAAATAAVIAGVALGLVAAVAAGGITGGEWSSIGVPPVPFALVLAIGLGVVGAGIAALGRETGTALVPAPAAAELADETAEALDELPEPEEASRADEDEPAETPVESPGAVAAQAVNAEALPDDCDEAADEPPQGG